MDSHTDTERQAQHTATPPKTDVVIGPSTPLPEKKGVQSEFSAELPKQHAQLVMRGILAPVRRHLQDTAFAAPIESPEQLIQSLQHAQESLQTSAEVPSPEIARLANFERLAQVALEQLDPADEEYTIKVQRQKLVLERMVGEAGFIPRSAFYHIAQERMDKIMKWIEVKRSNNILVQDDIDRANKQMAILTQYGTGALLMPDELTQFIPLLTENGIMLKLDSNTRSYLDGVSNQYQAYVSALSQDSTEANQKTIGEWLKSSQYTAQELEAALGAVSQFTASAERRKEITDKIVRSGGNIGLMLMLLALAIGATGLSSMDHA
ncbi:MAG: hypothetical protein NUV52_02640 [Candidatus Roizmanbacteria bacterium]|nr:hypothetical protein [Candidatus Roizmanbacteria bacterium]